MIFVGGNIRKKVARTFRASLGKFGQKSFASPKICLLLHLCIQAQRFLVKVENTTKDNPFQILFYL